MLALESHCRKEHDPDPRFQISLGHGFGRERDFISTRRGSDNRPIYAIQLQLRRVILGSPTRTGSSSTTHSRGLKVRSQPSYYYEGIILLMFCCCQMDQQNHKFFCLFL
jgi:hypothetical protein